MGIENIALALPFLRIVALQAQTSAACDYCVKTSPHQPMPAIAASDTGALNGRDRTAPNVPILQTNARSTFPLYC
jgi:hypothetical protein